VPKCTRKISLSGSKRKNKKCKIEVTAFWVAMPFTGSCYLRKEICSDLSVRSLEILDLLEKNT
jgi:hypothetical protein